MNGVLDMSFRGSIVDWTYKWSKTSSKINGDFFSIAYEKTPYQGMLNLSVAHV